MNKRRLFVGPIAKANQPVTSYYVDQNGISSKTLSRIPNKAQSAFANVATGAMITYDAYQALPPSVKAQFVNFGKAIKSGIIKSNNNNNNNRRNKMNGNRKGKRNNMPKTEGYGNNEADQGTFYLSTAVKPIPVSIKSGIIPNTYVSDYMDAIENSCSPLHLSSAVLTIPSTTTFDINKYFQQVTAFDIQSKAQANVGFSLGITSSFTATQLLAAFNALMESLQCYFYMTSIISYHDNPANKNMGMIALRNAMTAEDFNDLAMLGRRLADTPCPPNLLKLCKYLSGNYLTGTNPGSPMIKLVPHWLAADGIITDTYLRQMLALLSNTDNSNVFALLRRAVPQWVPGVLDDVPSQPVYDEQFKTIFANLPFRLFNTGTSVSMGFPYVINGSDIQYNSYSNDLDGVAFAMCGYYAVNDDDCVPGLLRPFYADTVALGSSRRSYYVKSGVKSFYKVEDTPYLCRARPETIQAVGNNTVQIQDPLHLPGANKCLGVSTKTLTETSYKVIDWMMSLNTIKKGLVTKQLL